LFAVYAFIAAGLKAARAFSSAKQGRSSGTFCSRPAAMKEEAANKMTLRQRVTEEQASP
jgi:hypothetical protein